MSINEWGKRRHAPAPRAPSPDPPPLLPLAACYLPQHAADDPLHHARRDGPHARLLPHPCTRTCISTRWARPRTRMHIDKMGTPAYANAYRQDGHARVRECISTRWARPRTRMHIDTLGRTSTRRPRWRRAAAACETRTTKRTTITLTVAPARARIREYISQRPRVHIAASANAYRSIRECISQHPRVHSANTAPAYANAYRSIRECISQHPRVHIANTAPSYANAYRSIRECISQHPRVHIANTAPSYANAIRARTCRGPQPEHGRRLPRVPNESPARRQQRNCSAPISPACALNRARHTRAARSSSVAHTRTQTQNATLEPHHATMHAALVRRAPHVFGAHE